MGGVESVLSTSETEQPASSPYSSPFPKAREPAYSLNSSPPTRASARPASPEALGFCGSARESAEGSQDDEEHAMLGLECCASMIKPGEGEELESLQSRLCGTRSMFGVSADFAPNSHSRELTHEGSQRKLYKFSEEGKVRMLEILLSSQTSTVQINRKNDKGTTALHLAAEHGHMSVVKLLLQHGAIVNMNAEGLTPAQLAAKCGHQDLVLFFERQPGGSDAAAQTAANAEIDRTRTTDSELERLTDKVKRPEGFNNDHSISLKAVCISQFKAEDKNPVQGSSFPEINMWKGDRIKIVEYDDKRGYCLVNNLSTSRKGWVPGGYVIDGKYTFGPPPDLAKELIQEEKGDVKHRVRPVSLREQENHSHKHQHGTVSHLSRTHIA